MTSRPTLCESIIKATENRRNAPRARANGRAVRDHAAYFHALTRAESEPDAAWRSALAGLIALRLVDAWAEREALPDEGLSAFESAINMMDIDAVERAPLQRLAEAFRAEGSRRAADHASTVLILVHKYAEVLWKLSAWPLATDCCRTIIRHARTPAENEIVPPTYNRLGQCLRALAEPDAACEAFQKGRAFATERGDLAGDLQLRISEAGIEAQRGHDTAAECLLDEVTAEATFAGLPLLVAQATHDRGTLVYARGDTTRALELYLRAMAAYGTDLGAERVLADIALVWLDQGHHQIAGNILRALAAYSTEQSQRAAAKVNLVRIAVLGGNEAQFEGCRCALSGATLSARQEAHYHVFVGEGWLEFDRPKLARQSLDRADDVIQRGKIIELETRLSNCRRRLEALLEKRKAKSGAAQANRTKEPATPSASMDVQQLMARTSAAALKWQGGRQPMVSGGY